MNNKKKAVDYLNGRRDTIKKGTSELEDWTQEFS